MPYIISKRLVSNGSLKIGPQIERRWRYHIGGCNSLGDPLLDAANTPGVPVWGDPYEFNGDLRAMEIEATPVGGKFKDQAFVDVVFATQYIVTTIRTQSYQIQSAFDKDGKPLTIPYHDNTKPDNLVPFILGGKLQADPLDYGKALVFRSDIVLGFQLYEYAATKKAADYVERLNEIDWQGRPAKRWRCMSADAISQEGGRRWQRNYIFCYRERGWNDPVFFVDRISGMIPPDVGNDEDIRNPDKTGGNGWIRPDMYKLSDFNNLGLPDVSKLI